MTLGMVLDGCRGAGMEALEAIVSVSTRAVISSTVAVGGLGGLGQGWAAAIAWPTHFLVSSPLEAGWLRILVEVVSG